MSIRTKYLLVLLAALAATATIALEVSRLLDNRAARLEITRARLTALASTSPQITPDEAKLWLEQHGYQVVHWNPHDPRGFLAQEQGPAGTFAIVIGQRPLRPATSDPHLSYLNLTFRFTPTEKFLTIDSDASPLQLRTAPPLSR